uniref:Cellular tumor antigen p53 n=2 Tax=Culex pipiens TaxID=7175 RepID=A0A8D8GDE7_CULPI
MPKTEYSPTQTGQDPLVVSHQGRLLFCLESLFESNKLELFNQPFQDQSISLKKPGHHGPLNMIAPDTDILLDEFSDPSVDFRITLDKTGERDIYETSTKLNRIYTSTDRSITFDIVCKPRPDFNPKVRIMLVCANLLNHPLARCSYHRKGDNTTFNEHVVRHKDALAEYVGTATGKLFPERLAILVPLDESGLKSISLDFVCLNSCHKIRKLKLALVFTLEDQDSGNIFARRVFNIQISKNFKRDMEVAEKGPPAKRPAANPPDIDVEPPAKQPLLEPSTSQQPSSHAVNINLNFNLPLEAAQEFLNNAEHFFKAKLYQANEQQKRDLLPCLGKIRKELNSLSDKQEDEKKD